MLREGSFLLWRFRKSGTDWQIFAHYAGRSSYTKGLLLIDNTGVSVEWTTEKCDCRTRNASNGWISVNMSQTLVTGKNGSSSINITRLPKRRARRFEVDLREEGRKIATLHVHCMVDWQIDTKVSMFRPHDIRLVEGQTGHRENEEKRERENKQGLMQGNGRWQGEAAQAKLFGKRAQSEDQEFLQDKSWTELRGSRRAAHYLQRMDESGKGIMLLNQLSACTGAKKSQAAKICSKHLSQALISNVRSEEPHV